MKNDRKRDGYSQKRERHEKAHSVSETIIKIIISNNKTFKVATVTDPIGSPIFPLHGL